MTMKLAIPSIGRGGKRSRVSDVFAKAPYFTFVEIQGGEMSGATVRENEASGMKQGAGPVVTKNLKDSGVDIVVAGEIGPGAKTLIEIGGIELFTVEPGIVVSEAVRRFIASQK